jgi:hypothetical protein
MMSPERWECSLGPSVDAASLAVDHGMWRVMAFEPDAAAQCGENALPALDACVYQISAPVQIVDVHIAEITKAQVHGHFATVTLGLGGTNIDFSGTDITVVPANGGKDSTP